MKRPPKLKLDPANRYRLSNGLELMAPPEVPFREMFSEIITAGCYTPSPEFQVRAGDTVLDIGANVGLFSIEVALQVPSARIHAFEAASNNVAALAANVRNNHLRNITVHHCAVSSGRSRRVTLYCGYHGGIHSIRPEYRNWEPSMGRPRRTESVRALSLAQIFSRYKIQTADFLKLDCEGAEYEILFSTPPSILSRIRRIAGEYHDLNARNRGGILKAFLEKNGFQTRFKAAGRGLPWGMFFATFRQPGRP